MKSTFHIDTLGNLQAVETNWLFDQYYSLITLADLLTEHGGDQEKGLLAMADTMIGNLEKHNFFSTLRLAQVPQPVPRPEQYSLDTLIIDQREILELSMRFEMQPPLPVEDKALLWQVYDPSFYIAMAHGDLSEIHLQQAQPGLCTASIDYPEPSEELLAYAASLDRSRRDSDGLGAHFAESIFIRCKGSSGPQ